MGKAYAIKSGDPLMLVTVHVGGGPQIPLQINQNLLDFDSTPVLEQNPHPSVALEMDYRAKLEEVRRGVQGIRRGIDGHPKDFQLVNFPLIKPMNLPPPAQPPPFLQRATMPQMPMQMQTHYQGYGQPVTQSFYPQPAVGSSMYPQMQGQQPQGMYPQFR
jgi:hypothetical protein